VARTATSIRNGATSPLAGIVHSLFLILVIVVLAPLASGIPLAALSAILFFVAWNMCDVRHFSRLLRTAPRSDKLLLLITFGLTVFVDLVVAVNVGVVIAALLFMRRMAESVSVQEQVFGTTSPNDVANDAAERLTLPHNVLVYRIEGPFFFGAAEKLESTLERVQHDIRTVVLRLELVPFMDATGMQTLAEIVERFQRRHVRVMLCGMRPNLFEALRSVGTIELVGETNVCRDMKEVAQRIEPAV
jgi:sulfate permease, SulP family